MKINQIFSLMIFNFDFDFDFTLFWLLCFMFLLIFYPVILIHSRLFLMSLTLLWLSENGNARSSCLIIISKTIFVYKVSRQNIQTDADTATSLTSLSLIFPQQSHHFSWPLLVSCQAASRLECPSKSFSDLCVHPSLSPPVNIFKFTNMPTPNPQ